MEYPPFPGFRNEAFDFFRQLAENNQRDWFKPRNLRRLFEARLAELARHFVDRMLAHDGACDFARDIALYYPLHVIMSILGVPESDEPRMLRLTQQMFGNEDPAADIADPAGSFDIEDVLLFLQLYAGGCQ